MCMSCILQDMFFRHLAEMVWVVDKAVSFGPQVVGVVEMALDGFNASDRVDLTNFATSGMYHGCLFCIFVSWSSFVL